MARRIEEAEGRLVELTKLLDTEIDFTTQKIKDLDARIDAINTDACAPVTVDNLIRQTKPPFTERVMRIRVSSKFKLPTQIMVYEGKTDPMDHLDSYMNLMSLQGYSDEVMCKTFSATLKVVLEVEGANDKVVIMAMMEGLCPGPLFDSFSKNVPETLSTLQSKADKYIATEELVEAKHRRRGREDHKRKEFDSRRANYRDEVLMEIKNEEFIKWPGKIKIDPRKRNKNKYCEFHRDHGHNTEECF
ncbi:hypothetical protein Acr_05g0009680 [Actinidia rufa]|uniref:Uncharacterized protein n=1 Tax=Actinidia rufa TaxID=165716 RepID=A0A7J0EMX0_9ERIC|nr:hypothetical protein Acr_05g0009680 [Actinidia rufa]